MPAQLRLDVPDGSLIELGGVVDSCGRAASGAELAPLHNVEMSGNRGRQTCLVWKGSNVVCDGLKELDIAITGTTIHGHWDGEGPPIWTGSPRCCGCSERLATAPSP